MTDKHVVKASEAPCFAVDEYMTIWGYFDKNDAEQVSIVKGHLNGPHSKRLNKRSVKLYYVLSGSMSAIVDNKSSYQLSAGDSLLVKPNHWIYLEGGNAEILIICAPSFDESDEVIPE